MGESNVFLKPQCERIVYMDLIRVLACLMVIFAHCGDSFMFRDTPPDSGAIFYASLLRSCVPFFVMLSGALLLPLHQGMGDFFKRRFTRVAIPFLIWSILYAVLPFPANPSVSGTSNALAQYFAGDNALPPVLYHIMMIPFNFTDHNVHFWFIFILIGLYLFYPILSPWIRDAKRSHLLFFLGIWTFTLFLPYLNLLFPELHGVCAWNTYPTTYYFAGYLGYALLGYYLVKYPLKSTAKALGVGLALFGVGFAITWFGLIHYAKEWFDLRMIAGATDPLPDALAAFYIPRNIDAVIEFPIQNLTVNVVMMSAGLFMILQRINLSGIIKSLTIRLSNLSYGIFLVHYIISLWMVELLARISFPDAMQNALVQVPIRAVLVFMVSWLIIELLAKLPKSKYIVG